jgi:hypothetical protein
VPDFGVTLPGIGERVAEREGDFALALLDQVEVLDRGLGRLHRRLRILDLLGIDFRHRDAERVIHAACATGQNIDELVGVGLKRQRDHRADESHSAKTSSGNHRSILLVSSIFQFAFTACAQMLTRSVPAANARTLRTIAAQVQEVSSRSRGCQPKLGKILPIGASGSAESCRN